ncbi:MAG: sugar nucleotide-binding protein [Planctomycetota bacterium]
MSKTNVLILGASGMLGSMITDYLSLDEDLSVTATVRSSKLVNVVSARIRDAKWHTFEVKKDEAQTAKQLCNLGKPDWIINAIGIIKPYIHDDRLMEVERAIIVNAMFPYWLAQAFERSRILQIATDCVYSGSRGNYLESDKHDPLDVYGKTKSLGEVFLHNISHLRCSIFGPEPKNYLSLLEWFHQQPANATLSGFTNHLWNGLPTLHFAKICRGIIKNHIPVPHIQHIVPGNDITKHDLLHCFARCFGRSDIEITPCEAEEKIDRRLATENKQLNHKLWKSAGYEKQPPKIEQMLEELAMFEYRLGNLVT